AEAASTVSMLSFLHVRMIRTAISPRFAMSTRRSAPAARRLRASAKRLTCLAHAQERFAVFGERAIGDENFGHGAADAGAHCIHEFHDFDDGDDCVFFYLLADLNERRRAWLGRAIEGA